MQQGRWQQNDPGIRGSKALQVLPIFVQNARNVCVLSLDFHPVLDAPHPMGPGIGYMLTRILHWMTDTSGWMKMCTKVQHF